jgi:peptidoglycan/xylan/chitin deacetylase (PgdA/CDA1 family)
MAAIRTGALRAGLETLYFSGVHRLVRPLLGGVGAILAFHRVRPPQADAFQPNRHLEVSPAFLADTIRLLRAHGIDIVPIDEAHRRLTEGDFARRFAVLTFEHGYRDTLTHALPVLKRYDAPFVVYVPSSFADGDGMLWWLALESAIARNERIVAAHEGKRLVFDCATLAAKMATWNALSSTFVDNPDEELMRDAVREIAAASGIDLRKQSREACMGWDELAELTETRLATIGAQTARHPILTRLRLSDAREEVEAGARRIEARLGVRPCHFAYPAGDVAAAGRREFTLAAKAGFKTAVTTRPGVIFADHRRALTALPRLAVDGKFQRIRYLDVLLSGAATALWNGFRRVHAA